MATIGQAGWGRRPWPQPGSGGGPLRLKEKA